ncbi:MAG: DoxX family membrane protein [Bacteroidales bacterium]|nr:DoxX family membrane protein [Lentimicrobiaceae bacterium]MDD5693789.1 DoxX family membrane protein [Bacteroidales bacterium]
MNYSKGQIVALVSLRIVIGWHFLFEGLTKVFQPGWTSSAYLLDSKGFLSGFFIWIASHASVLSVADFLNEWGLTLIGLSLILGLFTRISCIFGMLLLLFYYLSHPSWIGYEYVFPSEGAYFIVNKNIIEIFALLVIFFFPTDRILGVRRLLGKGDNS